MNELVKVINKEPSVSTFNIWEGLGYSEHRQLRKLVNANKVSFLELGIITDFESAEIGVARPAGRPEKGLLLNYDQVMLLITMVRPSEITNKFKVMLIKEFKRLREEIAKQHKPDVTISSAHIEEIRKILLLYYWMRH